MRSVRWLVSYILVASLGLWLAFALSLKFMGPARSQEAPSSGELPAEFMSEVDSTQAPASTPATPATPTTATTPASIPPPPPTAEAPAVEGGAAVTNSLPPPPPESSVVNVTADGYRYDPTGKRDPFKVFKQIRVLTPQEANKATNRVMEPLQRWELERLQVVGILWDVRNPRAMVRDPDGAVFTVVKNSKIGRSEGFVAAIREGEVVVVETTYDNGNSIKESRVLELKK